jgi:anti-sigma factor RsiW
MTKCIEPSQIKEGDLMAYVEGEADGRVRDHVGRCPACAGKVAQLRRTNQALLTLMYRASCPLSEVLGQYQLDLLSPDERLKVAAHVRTCPHCSRELDELRTRKDDLTHAVLQVIQGAVRVVEAALVTPPRLRPVGVRGRGREARAEQRAFHGAGLDVLVGFQPVATHKREGTLVGAVVQAEAVAGGRAWLFQEGEKPTFSLVDELGTFTFEEIRPGEYDLALEVGDEALLMREVVVG